MTDELLNLPQGETYIRWDGPEKGSVLLMVHGATVPHWQFDELVPILNAAGIRTLRLDLYGHGDSARPPMRYSMDVFVAQVRDTLEARIIGCP